jgi:Protein of unknown function (DUF664)
MAHPLVEQLRFTRREFQRDLEGLSDEDAVKRVGPANCIAWNISHLAWQEQRYWLLRGQDGHAPPGRQRAVRLRSRRQHAAWATWRPSAL